MTAMTARLFAKTSNWMVHGIHTACAVLVVVFAASVFLVLDASVEQANKFGQATERKLVQQEFQHQIDEIVKYQAAVSIWDATVAQIRSAEFSKYFVERQLRNRLWSEFGFSWTVFVPTGKPAAIAINRGEEVSPDKADTLLFWIDDLVYEATQNYWGAMKKTDGGFIIRKPAADPDLLSPELPFIHASDMRMVDGRLSIVVVQAVLPRSLFIPAGFEQPTLMVSVKPISDKMLSIMSDRLGISGLHVVKQDELKDDPTAYTPVGKGFTDGPFLVAWQPNAPGPTIWEAVMPKVALLSTLAAISMGFIAWRFGMLVRALQRSEASNRFLAKHDGLTGLANRIGFQEALEAFTNTDRNGPLSIIAADLDKFKTVNDRFGHAAGDAVLKTIAQRFRDRVGDRGIVARLGGDEFMVILRDVSNREEALAIANGMVIDAQIPIPYNNLLLQVGSSAGIAFYPQHGRNLRNLVHSADMALYQAKNSGRGRSVIFESEQPEAVAPEETQSAA